MDTVIFEPDLIEYAVLENSLSDAKVMGGVYTNESELILQTFAIVKLLPFAPLFDAQKSMS